MSPSHLVDRATEAGVGGCRAAARVALAVAGRVSGGVWVPETRPWSLTCGDAGRCRVLVSRIIYRFLVSLARLTVRSRRSKDLEIIVLRTDSLCCAGRTTDRACPRPIWRTLVLLTPPSNAKSQVSLPRIAF